MKAIRVYENGGPEKLLLEDVPLPKPQEGQARVKIHAIGLNFIDVYHRTGLYKTPLPVTPGMEAAGVVDEIGPGVTQVRPGERVAYAMSLGAYAEFAVVNARLLASLPESIDFKAAAGLMLQGMTAHYLTHSTFPVQPGQTALVHAAAG
ncbi:MAG: alcohol dehydrogenase catalytic domain-containing protein, partial [Acidobacteria bacterium]|nr:alcohol dehydrogenase catalytic domain-containing protein [Acidobacteriota bacterium]